MDESLGSDRLSLYQGKEFYDASGWYDFHARMYDPALGRFLSVDPQNQFAWPYTGMGNNPIIGIDPDGEFVLAAMVIGAAVGSYSGYKIGKANGATGWSMAGDIAGRALIGGVSGAAGASIAAGGGFMAKTSELAFASTYNSIGMSALSGGQTPVNDKLWCLFGKLV